MTNLSSVKLWRWRYASSNRWKRNGRTIKTNCSWSRQALDEEEECRPYKQRQQTLWLLRTCAWNMADTNPRFITHNTREFQTWRNITQSLRRGRINESILHLTQQFYDEKEHSTQQPLELALLTRIQEHFKDQHQVLIFKRTNDSMTTKRLFLGCFTAEHKLMLEIVSEFGVFHVNLIKSVFAYFEKPYYCWPCVEAYNNKDKHVWKSSDY